MMKDMIFQTSVVDYTHDGKGVVRYNDIPLFVENVLVDEAVTVEITKLKKRYGFGKVINRVVDSPNRVAPICPVYDKCGGCQIQHLAYQEQVAFKKEKIKNAFYKNAGLILNEIAFISNPSAWAYRNKISIPLQKKDVIELGFYEQKTNNIIAIDTCYLQEDIINQILSKLKALLNARPVSIYDKHPHKGYLRQIVLRSSHSNQQVLLGLVINDKNYHNELDWHIEKITDAFKEIKGVVINFNTSKNNAILGPENLLVYGSSYIIDNFNNLKFAISLNSFYQVNHQQMINLYDKALELANFKQTDIILDAYCGVGTIGMYASKQVAKVIGVDIVDSAIKDAKNNAQINNISNIEFICDDVEKYMIESTDKFDGVILDPPRKGCSLSFLEALIKIKPQKIIYIACDVATQARDVKVLIDHGYQLQDICGVDMFSQTHHVENIVVLKL